ncbi:MAG: choice-of-anchor Q domain-containing protein [Opitutaceae bacterium]
MKLTARTPLYDKIRRIALYLLLAAIPGTGHMEGAPETEQTGGPSASPTAAGPTFYVDATGGSDANDGLTVATAWQTLDRVNSSAVPPGSTVLFKRGEIWRGQIRPRSGTARHPTRYGAWGTGAKPAILGSVNRKNPGDWVNGVGHWTNRDGKNLWRCVTPFDTDTGNLIFNGATSCGFKKWSQKDLSAQGDYYYDRGTRQLMMYSTANPGSVYREIEIALRRDIVDQNNASFVTYEDLAIKYGAAHGFGGTNNAFITIRNCEISFIGGGDLFMDGSDIRYGNGVEFWANAHDCLVEQCRLWEIYDTPLTNQNTFENVSQYNITYRNNVMWNYAYGALECWSTTASSTMAHIRFENNTCIGAGEGWGKPPQRPDPSGYQLVLRGTPGKIADVCIRNNILYQSTGSLLWIQYTSQWAAALTLDHNCWYQAEGNVVYLEDLGKAYTMSQFPAYQSFTGKDAHSQAADPLFVNAGAHDYHLQAGSPCVDAGADTGIADDGDGRPRPAGRGPDIGAYER